MEGEFYHLYNRGNSKQAVFLDDQDRDRFIKLLYLCNSNKDFRFREDIIQSKIDAYDFDRGQPIVAIGAWVLMPNHFHLYVTPIPLNLVKGEENERVNNVSAFMHKLTKAYSRYFNTRHTRTGSLFEGKFKSVHVENDVQAKYLFAYIHLNPVKLIQSDWKEKGITDVDAALGFLQKYAWGSYADFKGMTRRENKILSRQNFPDYFPTMEKFDAEIFDWITVGAEDDFPIA